MIMSIVTRAEEDSNNNTCNNNNNALLLQHAEAVFNVCIIACWVPTHQWSACEPAVSSERRRPTNCSQLSALHWYMITDVNTWWTHSWSQMWTHEHVHDHRCEHMMNTYMITDVNTWWTHSWSQMWTHDEHIHDHRREHINTYVITNAVCVLLCSVSDAHVFWSK